jgi:hypothetical protein
VKFFASQNEAFPLTKTRLFKQMAAENLICYDKRETGNNYTIQKRVGQEKHRFIVMSRKTLQEK